MEITSSIQDVDPVTKKISITIPAADVAKQLEVAFAKVSQNARIKGFRPGKAPRNLVEGMYGERVRAEVTQDLIEEGIKSAAKKHNLSIVGSPTVESPQFNPGSSFDFTADVSIYPKPEVTGYEGLEISTPKLEVKDDEVDSVIEYLRKSRAAVRPLEGRTILQMGDVGRADFEVWEDGGKPSQPEPYTFCLGDKQLPEEVEKAFEGMAVNETREAVVPPRSGEAKTVTYRGTLRQISERILPEVDDAFAKLVEPAVASVLELRLKIRESLEKEKEQEQVAALNGAIIEKLCAANEFLIPQVLVDDEIRSLLVRRGFIDPQKMNPSQLPMEVFRKELGDAAVRRVRAAIVIDRIAEIKGIKLEKEDVAAGVQQFAAENRIALEEAQREIFQGDRAMTFMVEMVRNKVLDTLRKDAKITFTT